MGPEYMTPWTFSHHVLVTNGLNLQICLSTNMLKGNNYAKIHFHFRKVNLSFDFGNFAMHYWASFAKQHGCLVQGNAVKMDMTASLSLVDPEGDPILRRRKQTKWSVEKHHGQLDRCTMWLCSANNDGLEVKYCK